MSLLKRLEQGSQTTPGSPTDLDSKSRLLSAQSRRVPPPGVSAQKDTYTDLKTRVQNRLFAELDPTMDVTKVSEVRSTILELFEQVLAEENTVLSRPERVRLYEQIVAEIIGLGPLQPLLDDQTITEIMVNGAKNLYVERAGKIHRVPLTFESDEHVMRIIERIVSPLGRRIDESSPYVDARLGDGSRVNAVIPPISLVGPVITIRKFAKNPITIDQLIQLSLPGIDNWGHIGGLVGGLMFTSLAGPLWDVEAGLFGYSLVDRRPARDVLVGAATVVIVFGALAFWGMVR